MNRPRRAALWVLFGLYITAMFYLLFFQRIGRSSSMTYLELLHANLNLIPFQTIRKFLLVLKWGIQRGSYTLLKIAAVNLLGNVLAFVPLGLFLPCFWVKLRSFPRFLGTVAIIVLIVEIIQLFTLLGSCDIDDLILNLPGAALGYGIYKAMSHNRPPASSGCPPAERNGQ